MKLKKLEIHNIASIEDAVIDFEAKPLSDSNVILITGDTGAGSDTGRSGKQLRKQMSIVSERWQTEKEA